MALSSSGEGLATPIFSSLKHCRLSAEIILVGSSCASPTAAAVLPTAVGPTIMMTARSFIRGGFFAFALFLTFALFRRRIRTIFLLYPKSFRPLGEVIFLLYLGELV